MYVKMLDRLSSKLESNPESSKSEICLILFELICQFLNEFFLLSNNTSTEFSANILDLDEIDTVSSALPAQQKSNSNLYSSSSYSLNLSKSEKIELTASRRASTNMHRQSLVPLNSSENQQKGYEQHNGEKQLELKFDKQFFEFMENVLAKIYQKINKISENLNLNQFIPILISSQLILFKYQQSSKFSSLSPPSDISKTQIQVEQDLSKSVIDMVSVNMNLLDNELIIGILLKLYMKCGTFRYLLNECTDFHTNLIGLLNKVFEDLRSLNQSSSGRKHELIAVQIKSNYLEILLDLIFVFFYFNQKV